MSANLVFGITSRRKDDDLVPEVQDALDEICGKLDADWDMLAWIRGQSIRMLVYAPVECRSIVYQDEMNLRSQPALLLSGDMRRQGNIWIIPEYDTDADALREAESILDDWNSDFISPDNLNLGDRTGRKPPSEDSERKPPLLKSVPAVKESPRDEILAAFGISHEQAQDAELYVYKHFGGNPDEGGEEDEKGKARRPTRVSRRGGRNR